MSEKKCQRCGIGGANTYQKGLPEKVELCDGCWKKFTWARTERRSLWESDMTGFVQGYIDGAIPPYPDDPDFQRRLGLRALYRLRDKRARQRASLLRSFESRIDDVELASKILNEPFETLKKHVIVAEVSPGISAMESRMEKLLEQEPVYQHYLKNIRQAGKLGIVVCAGIVGEIGSARTLLCLRHERGGFTRPKIFYNCEHGKAVEDLSEALLVSRPNERAYGVHAFPTSSDLRSYFGLGFRPSGGSFAGAEDIEPWYIRKRVFSGENLDFSLLRKTLMVQYLAANCFETYPKNEPAFSWNQYYLEAKEEKTKQWQERFADFPPEKCSACLTSKCKKCRDYSGDWKRAKPSDEALWLCQCHDSPYRFGSTGHIRNHALGKTASFFLDLLFHTWRYLEGVGEEPSHKMAKMFLS